jgi:hypothetical protein
MIDQIAERYRSVAHWRGARMRRFYVYRWTSDERDEPRLLFIGQGVMFLTGLVTFGWGSGSGVRTFDSLEHMFDALHTRCLQFLDGEPPYPMKIQTATAHR